MSDQSPEAAYFRWMQDGGIPWREHRWMMFSLGPRGQGCWWCLKRAPETIEGFRQRYCA